MKRKGLLWPLVKMNGSLTKKMKFSEIGITGSQEMSETPRKEWSISSFPFERELSCPQLYGAQVPEGSSTVIPKSCGGRYLPTLPGLRTMSQRSCQTFCNWLSLSILLPWRKFFIFVSGPCDWEGLMPIWLPTKLWEFLQLFLKPHKSSPLPKLPRNQENLCNLSLSPGAGQVWPFSW